MYHIAGGRTAQAIVDQALTELKKIANARLGGKSVSFNLKWLKSSTNLVLDTSFLGHQLVLR